MRYLLRGQRGGILIFLVVTALVSSGLGWVTAMAMRLEEEQRRGRAEAERHGQLRLALWRMDSLIFPMLAREDGRPYDHYSAVYAPALALNNEGVMCSPGTVLEPSPLLTDALPDWMLLHFQVERDFGWRSPQVVPGLLQRRLSPGKPFAELLLTNATAPRERLLADLTRQLPVARLEGLARDRCVAALVTQPRLSERSMPSQPQAISAHAVENDSQSQQPNAPPYQITSAPQQQQLDMEYLNRALQQSKLLRDSKNPYQQADANVVWNNLRNNGMDWFMAAMREQSNGEAVDVHLSSLVPVWLTTEHQDEHLLMVRLVRIHRKDVYQGIVLDWPHLRQLLTAEVRDLFPQAVVRPVHDAIPPHPERTMTALPIELDPVTPVALPPAPRCSPLHVGLVLSWSAAVTALLAVALGGWSLIDLSERRFRFVSAVTHELRTPLTTLRLYLDMLTSGMIRDEHKKNDYLRTLNNEAERLYRLVSNVLDFSRLENQRPRLEQSQIHVNELCEQLSATWQGRCHDADKELVIDNAAGAASFTSDAGLIQQILGNLIDNACKYSKEAADRRIWLRVRIERPGHLTFEVEDRGPGVSNAEQRTIFRPFRRGRGADVTAGGVGLGLALAQRWAKLLGGGLHLSPRPAGQGACFRLELPIEHFPSCPRSSETPRGLRR
ncbi:MAG: sensor histidine kinase [Gemmataceae bacterium]